MLVKAVPVEGYISALFSLILDGSVGWWAGMYRYVCLW